MAGTLKCLLVALAMALCCMCVSGVEVVDLSGAWSLSNGGNVTTTASVPGVTFTDLLLQEIIDEPYYRYNDEAYRWISFDDWTYTRTFTLSASAAAEEKTLLWLEAVDTVADIYVNNKLVESTKSMFRRYLVDLTDHVVSGSNNVTLAFLSAATYAQRQRQESSYRIPFTHYKHGIPDRNYVRKAQCHFAWDWGPCFLSAGMWQGPVEVVSYSTAILTYVTPDIQQLPGTDSWEVVVVAYLDASSAGQSGTLTASVAGVTATANVTLAVKGENRVSVTFTVTNPSLWWPAGYGDPTLYPLAVEYHDGSGMAGPHQSFDVSVGFRTVELVQEPIAGQPGLSFYFQVNGQPIFIKGSNWVGGSQYFVFFSVLSDSSAQIPVDVFESRVTPARIKSLLQSVKDANMNLVRNWGGGIYQQDDFYAECDAMGIMVWEEFMFACAMYPRDEGFLHEVEEEVKHQVRRLAHHPSLVLWSGNNENEAALTGWYPETKSNPFRYVVDYNYLNTEVLFRTLRQYDPSRAWLPSSPSNELLQEEPYVERWGDPYSQYFGDTHYYNYDALCTDVSFFPTPRFASEYGWQSFPSLYTMAEASTPADWAYDSPLMDHRQHHPDGTQQINAMMRRLFTFPVSQNSTTQFENWSYLSQCVQAQCIRAQTEHYRRLMSSDAHTMGAIYWQLNSIWQAPTWSSLEYGGRWKLLHYQVAHFFAPTLVSSYVDATGMFFVYVTSEVGEEKAGMLDVAVRKWADGSRAYTVQQNAESAAYGSTEVYSVPLADLLASAGLAANEAVVTLTWTAGEESVENVFYPTSLGEVTLPLPTFSVDVAQEWKGGVVGEALVTVTSGAVAPFAFLHTRIQGKFNVNGLLLLPNEPQSFVFSGWEEYTLAELAASLAVRTIRDTYV